MVGAGPLSATLSPGAAEEAGIDQPGEMDGAGRLQPRPIPARLDLARVTGWVLGVVGFVVGARVIADNSFLTHLGTGTLILEQGSVPTTDPYSYLANGEPWTVQSWLVSVVYASLDAALGGWSIRLFHGGITAAVVLGMWRLLSPARQLFVRVALLSLTLLIGTYLWPPRPLLIGLLAMVLVLLVVQGHRPEWWLVPVFWVWVNSHGSFVLGCGLLGAVLLGAAIDERRLPRREVRFIAFGGAGCLLALINPLTWRLLWFPIHMMSRREALDRVSEWASPGFRAPVEQLFLVLLALIVVAASRKASWRSLVPALVFFIGGLLAVRNLGLASLVIVAMLAPAFEGLFGTTEGSEQGLIARTIGVVAAAGLVIVGLSVVTTGPVDLETYPTDEIDWLDARSLVAQDDVRIVQRDFVGNYLTLRYGADARVFMDDRFDFYPQHIIDDHNALLHAGDFAEIIDRREFDVAVWATKTPFRRWIDEQPDWIVPVENEEWFIACRTTSPVFDRCQT